MFSQEDAAARRRARKVEYDRPLNREEEALVAALRTLSPTRKSRVIEQATSRRPAAMRAVSPNR